MSIQFHCPNCRTLLSTSTDKPGSIVSCVRCHKDIVVPNLPPPVASPIPTIPVVPVVPLLKITCPCCGITGEISDRSPSNRKPMRCRKCGTRFQPRPHVSSVSPPAKKIDDELLPYIESEPLHDRESSGLGRRVSRFLIGQVSSWAGLTLIGVACLSLIFGVLIYFNLPTTDGHQRNGPTIVRPKAEVKVQPGDPGNDHVAAYETIFDAIVGLVFLALLVVVTLMLYFLPTLLAGMRGHQNVTAIAVLNIFLGWTFLGWVAALVWACTEVRSLGHHYYRR